MVRNTFQLILVLIQHLRISVVTDVPSGLQQPVLTVDKTHLTEGDDLTATCTAEGEIGSLTFYLKKASIELYREDTKNNQIEQKLSLPGGTGNLFCQYSINLGRKIVDSDNSNVIEVNIQGMANISVLS